MSILSACKPKASSSAASPTGKRHWQAPSVSSLTVNLKVVMLTALSQESDKERAESLGVDDYLVKSQVVIADVVDRIKHHLGVQ
jgi:CheY-like chemotaxis protein